MGDYAQALGEGAKLSADERNAVAEKLHAYTGLPVAYIMKANLRIERRRVRAGAADRCRADHGPPRLALLRPGDGPAERGSRLRSAVRGDQLGLCLGVQRLRAPHASLQRPCGLPSRRSTSSSGGNSSISRRSAVRGAERDQRDAGSRHGHEIQPEPEGAAERRLLRPGDALLRGHLRDAPSADIPESLQSNIEYHYYESGHMVYANEASLHQIHDNVAAFIRKTSQAGE